MRYAAWWVATASVFLTLGCSGSGTDAPISPGVAPGLTPPVASSVMSPAPMSLGAPVSHGLLSTSALAIYTLEVDPVTLTATSHLKETRAGQANDDLYLLSIDSFLNAGSFKVASVSATADTIELGYVVTHPFPAPSDPTGTPNGSTNRADLGIAGMVLFLADVPSATGNTYFTDRVANTGLVANADAYYSPGGLLTSGATANTFPFRQLVDETLNGTGSRLDISNGGSVTGNFGSDGWTRSEFGAGNNGWTGYGVLHQGQSSESVVSLDKDALAAGFSLDVAIIAKYNDPRGGATAAQKKANRLPPATADASLFAYRMPHGALDGGRIQVADEPAGFIANTISSAQISLHVDDWDARATETAAADLSEDPSFTNVAVGESGTPTVEVCIPGVLGDASTVAAVPTVVDDDSAYGGDAGQDSGAAGDPLFFSALVTKGIGSGQTAGDFTGLARVTDPESGLVIGLDGNLLPLGTPPAPITYQSFTVTQLPDNAPPTAVVALTSGDPLLSGTMPGVLVSTIADPENDPIDVEIDWGNGGGFQTIATGLMPPYADQSSAGPQMNNADLTPDVINVIVRLSDGTADVDYPLSYTLGPNRPPQVTGTPALSSASVMTPANFTMTVGTATATDPEGDAISYTITNNRNANQMTFATFPNSANSTAITNPPDATVAFTVYANDALHPTTGGTVYPVVNGTITPAGPQVGWVYTLTSSVTGIEHVYDIAIDPSGNVWITGDWVTTTPGVDFGGGLQANLTGDPFFLVKLNGATGAYMLHRVWNATSTSGRVVGLASDAAGNIYVNQTFNGTLNLAALSGTDQASNGTNQELAVLRFDNSGTLLGVARSDDTVNEGQESPPGVQSGVSTSWMGLGGHSIEVNQTTGAIYAAINPSNAGTMNIGATSLVLPNANRDAVLVRLDPASFNLAGTGSATWMVNLATGGVNQRIQAIAIDPSGDVICAGNFDSTTLATDFGDAPVLAVGGTDAFIVKRDGTTGAHEAGSQRTFGSSSTANEVVASLTSDANGYYVGGGWGTATAGQTLSLGAPLGNMVSTGGTEGFIGMFTHAGVPVWQRLVTGLSNDQASGGIGVADGDLFAYGLTTSTSMDWGYPPFTLLGSSDPMLGKFNRADGAASHWHRSWGSSGFDYNGTLAVFPSGDPVVAFRVANAGTYDFDPGPGVSNRTMNTSDFAVVKLSGASGTFF